MENKKR